MDHWIPEQHSFTVVDPAKLTLLITVLFGIAAEMIVLPMIM